MGLSSLESSRANTRGVPEKKQCCLKVVTWKSHPGLQSLSLAYGSDTSFQACVSQVIKISLYTHKHTHTTSSLCLSAEPWLTHQG